jgi:hypothetical protein
MKVVHYVKQYAIGSIKIQQSYILLTPFFLYGPQNKQWLIQH